MNFDLLIIYYFHQGYFYLNYNFNGPKQKMLGVFRELRISAHIPGHQTRQDQIRPSNEQ
jgi:hypothetical protein